MHQNHHNIMFWQRKMNHGKFHYLLFTIIAMTRLSSGAITGPMDEMGDIKLIDKENSKPNTKKIIKKYQKNPLPHRADIPRNRESQSPKLNQDHNSKNSLDLNQRMNLINKVEIIEPPDGSILAGGNFFVRVNIDAADENIFNEEYIQNKNGRICVSFDDGPYHCWPIENGRIFYSQATEV